MIYATEFEEILRNTWHIFGCYRDIPCTSTHSRPSTKRDISYRKYSLGSNVIYSRSLVMLCTVINTYVRVFINYPLVHLDRLAHLLHTPGFKLYNIPWCFN